MISGDNVDDDDNEDDDGDVIVMMMRMIENLGFCK